MTPQLPGRLVLLAALLCAPPAFAEVLDTPRLQGLVEGLSGDGWRLGAAQVGLDGQGQIAVLADLPAAAGATANAPPRTLILRIYAGEVPEAPLGRVGGLALVAGSRRQADRAILAAVAVAVAARLQPPDADGWTLPTPPPPEPDGARAPPDDNLGEDDDRLMLVLGTALGALFLAALLLAGLWLLRRKRGGDGIGARHGRLAQLGRVGLLGLGVLGLAHGAAALWLPSLDAWDCLHASPTVGPSCWTPVPACAGRYAGFGADQQPPATFRVNPEGHRGPVLALPLPGAPTATTRVVVHGASVLFGYGSEEGQTWLNAAHTHLADHARRDLRLINAAVAGYDLPKQLRDEPRWSAWRPDAVVFTVDAQLLRDDACRPWWALQDGLARASPLVRAWRALRLDPVMQASKAEREASVEAALAFRRAHPDLPAAIALLGPIAPPDETARLLGRLRSAGFVVFELGDRVLEALGDPSPGNERWLANGEGWSPRGHALVGPLLAEAIARWLPPHAADSAP
jgi:hypothetical protein